MYKMYVVYKSHVVKQNTLVFTNLANSTILVTPFCGTQRYVIFFFFFWNGSTNYWEEKKIALIIGEKLYVYNIGTNNRAVKAAQNLISPRELLATRRFKKNIYNNVSYTLLCTL